MLVLVLSALCAAIRLPERGNCSTRTAELLERLVLTCLGTLEDECLSVFANQVWLPNCRWCCYCLGTSLLLLLEGRKTRWTTLYKQTCTLWHAIISADINLWWAITSDMWHDMTSMIVEKTTTLLNLLENSFGPLGLLEDHSAVHHTWRSFRYRHWDVSWLFAVLIFFCANRTLALHKHCLNQKKNNEPHMTVFSMIQFWTRWQSINW